MNINISYNDFQEEIKEGITVLKLGNQRCPPCQRLKPMLKKLYESRQDFKLFDIDLDMNMEYARKYKVRSIPRTLIFKDGDLVEDFTGYQFEKVVRTLDGIKAQQTLNEDEKDGE